MRNWLSYFYPQLIKKVESSINPDIYVYRYWGKNQLVVGGLTQSGGLVNDLWQKAILEIKKPFSPKSALILGYGGGTIATLINNRWPNTKITGVDNDPVMVELGKKYLNKSTPDVVIEDAFVYMNKNNTQYDLIITDLYKGNNIPQQLFTEKFIENIQNSLTKNGCALFNIFALSKHEPQAKLFSQKLHQYFPTVTKLHTISNWIIQTSNSGKIAPGEIK